MLRCHGGAVRRGRHAYFQARHGNRVTLYADAVADPERLPPIKLARGLAFKCESLWDDMFAQICDAKHFIYMAGAPAGMDARPSSHGPSHHRWNSALDLPCSPCLVGPRKAQLCRPCILSRALTSTGARTGCEPSHAAAYRVDRSSQKQAISLALVWLYPHWVVCWMCEMESRLGMGLEPAGGSADTVRDG